MSLSKRERAQGLFKIKEEFKKQYKSIKKKKFNEYKNKIRLMSPETNKNSLLYMDIRRTDNKQGLKIYYNEAILSNSNVFVENITRGVIKMILFEKGLSNGIAYGLDFRETSLTYSKICKQYHIHNYGKTFPEIPTKYHVFRCSQCSRIIGVFQKLLSDEGKKIKFRGHTTLPLHYNEHHSGKQHIGTIADSRMVELTNKEAQKGYKFYQYTLKIWSEELQSE